MYLYLNIVEHVFLCDVFINKYYMKSFIVSAPSNPSKHGTNKDEHLNVNTPITDLSMYKLHLLKFYEYCWELPTKHK